MNGVILVVTHFPSPYQVELFDRIAELHSDLVVAYLHQRDRDRQWSHGAMRHRALLLSNEAQRQQAAELNRSARLVVYNYYQDRRALQLLRARDRSGMPWVFWGERPGLKNAWLGRAIRHVALHRLHRSRRPIWGIGRMAVDSYRKEFGSDRDYVNLPYFSNLDRYSAMASAPRDTPVVFVYSGSLSHRKGVDLLASAFVRLAKDDPRVRLRVVGRGNLESNIRATLAPVADRVDMAGFKDWEEAPRAYAGAHFLCVPSRHDGWALVVPEGLAAGLPVIAAECIGAAIDLISPGLNGWIVPGNAAEPFYQAMRTAAALAPSALEAMSTAARCSVASHTLDAGAARFLEAADQAVAASH